MPPSVVLASKTNFLKCLCFAVNREPSCHKQEFAQNPKLNENFRFKLQSERPTRVLDQKQQNFIHFKKYFIFILQKRNFPDILIGDSKKHLLFHLSM